MIHTFLLKQWKFGVIAVLAILLNVLFSLYSKEKKEVARQSSNVEVLNSNYTSYKAAYKTGLKNIHGKDSIIRLNAGKIRALTYTVDEYKQFSARDAQTIKELNISLKNAQSASNIETQTVTNTVIQLKDSCFNQVTDWQDISGCIKNGEISIKTTSRDSLIAVISTVSKHNFLFFHWGNKISSLDVVSKNPNTQIKGLKYTIIKH